MNTRLSTRTAGSVEFSHLKTALFTTLQPPLWQTQSSSSSNLHKLTERFIKGAMIWLVLLCIGLGAVSDFLVWVA